MNLVSLTLYQIELEDPLENVGVKLVRQAGAKTNDQAGDGSTTSVVLARGLIREGTKVNITSWTWVSYYINQNKMIRLENWHA